MRYWTDAHCHLQDEFLPGGAGADGVAQTLSRALGAGVGRVVVIGTDEATSRQALALAAPEGAVEVYATVGLHPHDAARDVGPILELARERPTGLVGVGETGLDYFYEHSPRAAQRAAFAAQIGLAHELDLALVVHARDAFEDLFAVLGSEGVPSRTVIHCFTGGPDDALACLALGCDVSFSGIVTFKNAQPVRDAAMLVPLERLHVETDSPFLAPVPRRGATNEPAWVSLVGEFIAELRGLEADAVAAATSANTARLYGLAVPQAT
jgi:TatD DNase family protein